MGGHTLGPLQVVEGYEVWDTRGDGAPGIPLVRADLGLNRRWGRDIHGSEIVANLTLFAAAPDLLEAVRRARRHAENLGINEGSYVAQLDGAIALATQSPIIKGGSDAF